MDDMKKRIQVDARRLLCPLPVIRVQDAAKTLASGDEIEVICTDPGALNDVPSWCKINRHHVLKIREEGGEIYILIQI